MVSGDNQVWKLNPISGSFALDTTFGGGDGKIGLFGIGDGQFDASYDVAVTFDDQEIVVSDTDNDRIQRISAIDGTFISAFGDSSHFNSLAGLTFDSGLSLNIVDSAGNEIHVGNGDAVNSSIGEFGTALGQLDNPLNISIDSSGIYIADNGNNRIQKLSGGIYSESCGCSLLIPVWEIHDYPDVASISPVAIAVSSLPGVASLDTIYVSDSLSGKILKIEVHKTTVVNAIAEAWDNMKQSLINEDIEGALVYFHSTAIPRYRETFLTLGTEMLKEIAIAMQPIMPSTIDEDSADYMIDQDISGVAITSIISFAKENGVWKIVEF